MPAAASIAIHLIVFAVWAALGLMIFTRPDREH
jgi:hypothetical protein